jgi:hypothetical protein
MATDLKTNAQKKFNEHCHFEDQLINNRLTWLLTSEALLFAGFGVIMSSDKVGLEKIDHWTFTFFVVGLSLAGLTFVSIVAAVLANLVYYCKLKKEKNEDENLTLGVFPPSTVAAWFVACAIPIAFAAGWLLIWIYNR